MRKVREVVVIIYCRLIICDDLKNKLKKLIYFNFVVYSVAFFFFFSSSRLFSSSGVVPFTHNPVIFRACSFILPHMLLMRCSPPFPLHADSMGRGGGVGVGSCHSAYSCND